MTLIDSLDSILMLYSYSGFPENGWAIFAHERVLVDIKHPVGVGVDEESATVGLTAASDQDPPHESSADGQGLQETTPTTPRHSSSHSKSPTGTADIPSPQADGMQRDLRVKENMMSGLSIVLTLMSILVAFGWVFFWLSLQCPCVLSAPAHRISMITIMALIGDQCRVCREAAEADDGHGGGLAGRWWRAWSTVCFLFSISLGRVDDVLQANDNSGFIGAAIVGWFVLVVTSWYGGRWCIRKYKARRGGANQ